MGNVIRPAAFNKKIEHHRIGNRNQEIPPPLTFDIYTLPQLTVLSERETAAALRRTLSTLEVWREQKDHPLTWRRVGGRIMYDLLPLLDFLEGDPNDDDTAT